MKKLFDIINIILMVALFGNMGYARQQQVDVAKYEKTIEGRVVDEDGNGVYNASVIVPEKNLTVKTSKTGRFVIDFKGGGSFHIEIYKIGYLPYSTGLLRSAATVNIKIGEIVLQSSPLEEVVVTGTSTPKLYRETPVKTQMSTRDQFEQRGALTLADTLEIMTGVRVENNCQNCNFNQVRINGMEGKYAQILINGQPIFSALAGVYGLEQIPVNMIEKLEVVKGGGSALYGGNAVAGVVNVILRVPERSGSQFSLSQEFINESEPNTTLNFNTDYISKSLNTVASVFSNYQRREPMDYNGDDFSDLGELTNVSFGANFSHYFSKINGKLKLNFDAIIEDRRGGNKLNLPEHFADIAESTRTNRVDVGIGWEQTFSADSILKFDTSYSFTKRKSYYGAEQDPYAYGHTENPIFYTNLAYHNFSLSHHAVVIGSSFRSDKLEDSAPAYGREISETYTDFGFYLQDEISMIKDRLSLLLGIRGDKHSEIGDLIFSPRVSLAYRGIKNLTFRTTYSTGFRAPQVFDEDLHITQVGGEGQIIVNAPGLEEEQSRSFTLGLDFGRQSKNRLYQFSLGGFYTRLDNAFTLREIDPIGNASVFERFNSSGARVYGIEVEAGFKLAGRFELFTGWTFQKSKYNTPEPDFNSEDFFRTPDVYGSLRIEYNIPKFLHLHSELTYTGSMKVPHFAGYIEEDVLEQSDPFVVINFSAGKEIRTGQGSSLTLTARVINILNDFQEDLDKGIYRDAGYVYGPRFPRTFRLELKYNF